MKTRRAAVVIALVAGTAMAAASAWAGSTEPGMPGVSKGAQAGSSRPGQRSADLALTRRAAAPGALDGDASFAGSTGAPGHATPDAGVRARLGLGHGFAAEIDATRAGIDGSFRPGAGLQWQFLGRHGGPLTMAVLGLYKPEGFTEPAGEMEVQYLGNLRLHRTELAWNLVAGGDPDFQESDVEGHLAAGYRFGRHLLLGAEERSRIGFGAKHDGYGRQEHVLGPMAQVGVGRFLVTGLVGAGALQAYGQAGLQVGAYGVARLAYCF